jgi:hypothetical protein
MSLAFGRVHTHGSATALLGWVLGGRVGTCDFSAGYLRISLELHLDGYSVEDERVAKAYMRILRTRPSASSYCVI